MKDYRPIVKIMGQNYTMGLRIIGSYVRIRGAIVRIIGVTFRIIEVILRIVVAYVRIIGVPFRPIIFRSTI